MLADIVYGPFPVYNVGDLIQKDIALFTVRNILLLIGSDQIICRKARSIDLFKIKPYNMYRIAKFFSKLIFQLLR